MQASGPNFTLDAIEIILFTEETMKALKTVTGSKLLHVCLGLAVLCLCQTTALPAKKQVERPFKAQITGTETIDMLNCEGVICPVHTQGLGVATHLGKYQLEGIEGFLDWSTGNAWGNGFMTAANGDQIFFESVTLAESGNTLTITGGTGRFEGASGTIIPTSCSTAIITGDFVTVITITNTCAAEGSITY